METCEVVRYAENGERLNPCKKLQQIINMNTFKLFEIHICDGDVETTSYVCKPNIVASSAFKHCPYCGVDIKPDLH